MGEATLLEKTKMEQWDCVGIEGTVQFERTGSDVGMAMLSVSNHRPAESQGVGVSRSSTSGQKFSPKLLEELVREYTSRLAFSQHNWLTTGTDRVVVFIHPSLNTQESQADIEGRFRESI